jgi:hypothetical protein
VVCLLHVFLQNFYRFLFSPVHATFSAIVTTLNWLSG